MTLACTHGFDDEAHEFQVGSEHHLIERVKRDPTNMPPRQHSRAISPASRRSPGEARGLVEAGTSSFFAMTESVPVRRACGRGMLPAHCECVIIVGR